MSDGNRDGFDGPTQIAATPDGRLVVAELNGGEGDGSGRGVAVEDELLVVGEGDDFGYPRCIGNRTPVAELDATDAGCVASPPSHALFAPGATPTSVAVAPWDGTTLLVALWNGGGVVAVPAAAGDEPHVGEPFLTGIDHAQHLLALGDRLLVVDHLGGRILAVSR